MDMVGRDDGELGEENCNQNKLYKNNFLMRKREK